MSLQCRFFLLDPLNIIMSLKKRSTCVCVCFYFCFSVTADYAPGDERPSGVNNHSTHGGVCDAQRVTAPSN